MKPKTHNDYLFDIRGDQFSWLRRFDDMYRNCEDPHGQSKELSRLDYQFVASVIARAIDLVSRDSEDVSMLDLGCGLGFFTAHAQAIFPAVSVSGCDISASAVEKAASQFPTCEFFQLDINNESALPNDAYSIITALHVICYFTDEEISGILRNIRTMLAPGGFVLVGHHIVENMRFGRFIQNIDDAYSLFEANGYKVLLTFDMINDLDLTYANEPVGRNIYFLAQRTSGD